MLFWIGVWFIASVPVCSLIGHYLRRRRKLYRMAADVRRGLDDHYCKSELHWGKWGEPADA